MMMRVFGGPHRYVQGPGALAELAPLVALYGRRPFVIVDAAVMDLIRPRLEAVFAAADVAATFAAFSGECTAEKIDKMAQQATAARSDVVIGVGGGKTIDNAKGVRIARGGALLIVPTVASNDAPTSRLVVLYRDDHSLSEVRLMATNPDAVVVDTKLIAGAPRRFFVAGIGDALSKKFEVEQCVRAGGLNFYKGRSTSLALMIADQCYRTVRADAVAALAAAAAKTPDEAFERVVEATILSSGLGFESGGLSISHALTRGFSAIADLSGALHGEQVAFGLLAQLCLEGRSDEFLADVRGFYRAVGLPASLADLGLRDDAAAAIETIAARTLKDAPYVQNFQSEVTQANLAAALARANAS
ncbi:MAG: glycerol dehydrogenase [Xanthobacteraceae bacterium]|nr:glycerol dehydrogenase [Xanthobacteraceae bacterium]